MNEIKESDWKLLRKLQPLALERLCMRLLAEIGKQCQAEGLPYHQRFKQTFRIVQDGDDEIGRAFDDLKRSTAVLKLAVMKSEGLITAEEFLGFTEETGERIRRLEPV